MVNEIYFAFVSKGCFTFLKASCKRIFSRIGGKIKPFFVLPALAICYSITRSFDLWMLKKFPPCYYKFGG
jgi:nucleoside recognition membrane protein YjiH